MNVFAAELHSFGAFKVELREKLTNASHAQKALLHVQGAKDFTPCHSVQPSGHPWSCKLTYGGAFGVLTTDDIMPATKLASLLYFMGHRYTATHRAAGSQLVKQLQALHANLAGAETDAEDVCTEVVQNYSTYAFPAGMEEVPPEPNLQRADLKACVRYAIHKDWQESTYLSGSKCRNYALRMLY